VLIDISRGSASAIRFIDSLEDPWWVSQVTSLLSLYGVLPLTDAIGARAYSPLKTYAKSHGLHVFDSLVAATALENQLTLVTLNPKHFQMIEGLPLQSSPY
jgi:predicted nucleic acid-binding protein